MELLQECPGSIRLIGSANAETKRTSGGYIVYIAIIKVHFGREMLKYKVPQVFQIKPQHK